MGARNVKYYKLKCDNILLIIINNIYIIIYNTFNQTIITY